MTRDEIISAFLKESFSKLGTQGTFIREKIPGDASFRRYEKIITDEKDYILMDAPPENEDVKPFIHVTNILEAIELKPPHIFNQDVNNGLLLLENLGENKLNILINNNPTKEIDYYKKCADVLVHIYNKSKENNFDLPEYSNDILLNEAALFPKWYLPLYEDMKDTQIKEFEALFTDLITTSLDRLNFENNILILRDFHADNIIFTEKEKELKNVGLIDYQDALIGNPSYDLLSLLEDARRDVNKKTQNEVINYYITRCGLKEKTEEFHKDYNILAAIRNLKILGIFCRLKLRDNKNNYLKFLPRVKKYLNNDLQDKALNELKSFLDKTCKTL